MRDDGAVNGGAMNATRLLAHYAHIADAPDAVARLRRFILDLAVRGKLVPQDPDDKPASEMIKRIAAEKARLVKAGEIRRDQPPSDVNQATFPISAPTGWALTRLVTICRRIHYGYTASADAALKDVRMLRITDIQDNAVDWAAVPGCSIDAERVNQYKLEKGDILIARTGGTIGKTFLVRDVPVTAVFASYLIRIQGTHCIFDEYLKLFLESPLYWTQLRDGTRGTGQPNVNGETLGLLLVPLPPLAEQKRIVAKVDELTALCDRLEAARTAREATRDKLAAASLARLSTPDPDPATFADHARFALDNIGALTARADQFRPLRQTILNLAVRGKLVPQDPSDAPASELLKRIAAEKQRLLKKSNVRTDATWTASGVGDLPFAMPERWRTATIRQILVELQTGPFGSSLHQSDYQLGGTPVINPASIQNERIVPIDKMAVGPATLQRLANFKLRLGDIVMARRGEMGRCAIVTHQEVGWLCGTGSLILRLPSCVHGRFFVMLIGSPYVREYLGGSAVGSTMQNLNQSILLDLVIALPPLAEQKRIVAKVDELMALCDRLEASLVAGEQARRRLLDALLSEALALGAAREAAA